MIPLELFQLGVIIALVAWCLVLRGRLTVSQHHRGVAERKAQALEVEVGELSGALVAIDPTFKAQSRAADPTTDPQRTRPRPYG